MRRSYAGDRCTIRYRGPVPPWDVPAFGVEWDNPKRGSGSGMLANVQYFTCTVEGAGSFVKTTREPDTEQSLASAITGKYVDIFVGDEIKLSENKTIETIGFDKVHQRQAQIDSQQFLSVHACRVASLDRGIFNLNLLERLDLSANIMCNWQEVTALFSQLPSLRQASVNDNRFLDGYVGCVVPHLEELDLTRTLISPDEISRVTSQFPLLRRLSLAQNLLQSIPPLKIEDVDLSGNSLSEVYLPLLEGCQQVNIAHNPLLQLSSDVFSSKINLQGTQIDWKDLQRLRKVSDLRLGWPLADRPYIIAHLGALTILDGTLISEQERTDAELYALTAASRRTHIQLPKLRWQQLVGKYGEPTPAPDQSIRGRLVVCRVDGRFVRIVKDAKIQRLVLVACRVLEKRVRGLKLKVSDRYLDPDEEVRDLTELERDTLVTTYE